MATFSRRASPLRRSRRGRSQIVECEKPVRDDVEFYIGRILGSGVTELSFAHFEADGVWEDRADTVLLEEITRIQIDIHYIKVYSRYLTGSIPEA